MALSDYEIRIFSPAGVIQARLTGGAGTSPTGGTAIEQYSGFTQLTYSKRVSDVGACRFRLHANSLAAQYLVDKAFIEVRRKNTGYGLGWTSEWVGLLRDPHNDRTDEPFLEVTALSLLHVLSWRHVLFPPGTANRSEFNSVAAETVAKTIVNYNCGALATTGNGRDRNGTLSQPSVSIQADGGGGNTISLACADDVVLDAIKKVYRIAGGDFDLVRANSTTAALQFNWYVGQLGTDRTSTVLFAPERGNMQGSVYEYKKSAEKTVAIVRGAGDSTFRDFVVRTGANYSATNDIETIVDARSTSAGNTTALNAAGDIALQRYQARQTFSFQPLQTSTSAYGVHYFLGDRVKARDYGLTTTQKIMGVTVDVKPTGEEAISLDMMTL